MNTAPNKFLSICKMPWNWYGYNYYILIWLTKSWLTRKDNNFHCLPVSVWTRNGIWIMFLWRVLEWLSLKINSNKVHCLSISSCSTRPRQFPNFQIISMIFKIKYVTLMLPTHLSNQYPLNEPCDTNKIMPSVYIKFPSKL